VLNGSVQSETRVLVITTSYCFDEGEWDFYGSIDVLISLSLFVFEVSSHMSCK